MEEGPNVDYIPKHPYLWSELKDNSFDIIISGQAFEHIEFFWFTLAEMSRVLREDGYMCIIAPRGFTRHRYPIDCYRFDADGMVALARYCNFIPCHVSTNLAPPNAPKEWYSVEQADSMLICQKPQNWQGMLTPNNYTFTPIDLEKLSGDFVAEVKKEKTSPIKKKKKGFSRIINSIKKRIPKL